jgi:alpha-D-xyloside xylohydrolase
METETDWDTLSERLLDIDWKRFLPCGEIIEVRAEANGAVSLTLKTGEGNLIPCRVDVCHNDVLRLRMGSFVLDPDELSKGAAAFTHSENASALTISTSEVSLRIGKSPWDFSLSNSRGKVLLQEDRYDTPHPGGNFITPPFGLVRNEAFSGWAGAFKLRADEAIYGLGEKFNSLNQRGQTAVCWNKASGPWKAGSHKNVPFFMSSRGYGIYFNTTSPVLIDIGQRSNSTLAFSVASESLDIYFFHGPSFKKILGRYTELTGRPPIPPAWGLGIWMSRCTYKSAAEIEEIAARFRREELPCDVFKLDVGWFSQGRGGIFDYDMQWNPEGFPEPEAFLARLKAVGFRVGVWVQSWHMRDSAVAQDARERGFLLRTKTGEEHSWLMDRTPVVALDLTIPECQVWFKQQLTKLLDQGVSTFFADWNISTPTNLVYRNGEGKDYNNAHSLLYNRLVFEAVAEHANGPAITWGIAGCAGIQRYPATYGGDARATFREAASVLRGGMSSAFSGISLWGLDIGGFQSQRGEAPERGLYIRYLQLGCFLPMAQFHGIPAREPWAYDDEVVAIYRKYTTLRYELLPYLFAQCVNASLTGVPVLRPMALEFQNDPTTANLDLQYMFGDAFLVAPMFEAEGSRTIYLPEGEWIDFWTDESHPGGRWIHYNAPLDTLPLFVRGGSIIPKGPRLTSISADVPEIRRLHCYGASGEPRGTYWDGTTLQRVRVDFRSGQGTLDVPPFGKLDIVLHPKATTVSVSRN